MLFLKGGIAQSILIAPGLLLVSASIGQCQEAAAERLAFEVTSVKLNKNCSQGSLTLVHGVFRAPCIRLRSLIRIAYSSSLLDLDHPAPRLQLIGGPPWIDSDEYSIEAKPKTGSTAAEVHGPMLQSLLEDRFGLKIHAEIRETPVYFLTLARPGAKPLFQKNDTCLLVDVLEPPEKPGPNGSRSGPRRCWESQESPSPAGTAANYFGVTMAYLASRVLSPYADRPVIDNTGLEGRFDLHLEYDPRARDMAYGPVPPAAVAVAAPADTPVVPSGLSIFAAAEKQLGLRLRAGKAPIKVYVIDGVDRPSEN
jgi:uncharacterized protein (TIGR03435 family)